MSDRVVIDGDTIITSTIDGEGGAYIRLGQNPVIEPLEVSENGTYSVPDGVDGFNPVTVALPEYEGAYTVEPSTETQTLATAGKVMTQDVTVGALDNSVLASIVDRTITELSDKSITRIGRYGLSDCSKLEKIDLQNVLTIGYMGLARCGLLTEVSLPNCEELGTYAFDSSPNIEKFYLPKLVRVIGNGVFYGNSLVTLVLPSLTYIGHSGLVSCAKLEALDVLGGRGNVFAAGVFNGCPLLETIVIRAKSLSGIQRASDMDSTKFGASGTGGKLYVPQEVMSLYTANTQWSEILNRPNNQMLPIEGSIYETRYVDGTPIQ